MSKKSTKRVPITVVFHLEMEFPEEYSSEDHVRFVVEENHCLSNHIETLGAMITADPGSCTVCNLGNAYVGHVSLNKIRELARIESDGPEPYACPGCGRSVAEFRWCEQYAGTESLRADGAVCCTDHEGKYPTAESAEEKLDAIRIGARAIRSRSKMGTL